MAVQPRRMFQAERSDRFSLNVNLGAKGAVHGAFVRNLEKLFPLFLIERTHEMNLAFNSVDLAFFCFAVPAIRRVDLRMSEIHGDPLERPFLRSRVKGYRHRRTGTERGQEQIVGRKSGISSADLNWFVCGQPMWTDDDLLGETRGGRAYHDICST